MVTQNIVKDTDMNEYFLETVEAGILTLTAQDLASATATAESMGLTVLSINECQGLTKGKTYAIMFTYTNKTGAVND